MRVTAASIVAISAHIFTIAASAQESAVQPAIQINQTVLVLPTNPETALAATPVTALSVSIQAATLEAPKPAAQVAAAAAAAGAAALATLEKPGEASLSTQQAAASPLPQGAAAATLAPATLPTEKVRADTAVATTPVSSDVQTTAVTPVAGTYVSESLQETTWLAAHMPQVYQMVQALTFAAVVKALCMAGNILVQVSPFPTVKHWESRGNTGEADAAPYVSIAFGGWQWCFYGSFAFLVTQQSGFLILVHANCLGAVLGSYYTYTFFRNCKDPNSMMGLQKYLSAAAALAVFQACAVLLLPAERALFLSGLVSSFCSFVGALSMLVTVPTVLATKDTRSIPGPLVVANLCSSCVWIVCGWMLQDMLVMVPNVVSSCAGLICVYLKIRYPDAIKTEGSSEKELADKEQLAWIKKRPGDFSECTPLVESINARIMETSDKKAAAPESTKLDIEASICNESEELANSADTGGTF